MHFVRLLSDSQNVKHLAISYKKEDQAVTYLANNPHDVCGSSVFSDRGVRCRMRLVFSMTGCGYMYKRLCRWSNDGAIMHRQDSDGPF